MTTLGNHLILVAFNIPLNWSTDYTSQTAKILSRNNVVICYMLTESKSLKEYLINLQVPKPWVKHETNLYLYTPIHLLPFRRFRIVEKINHYLNVQIVTIIAMILCKTKNLHRKILWVFEPKYYELVYKYFGASFDLLYDCVDHFCEENETKLIQSAKYFFVNSYALSRVHSPTRKPNAIVPQGFDLETFKKFHNLNYNDPKLPKDKPIIGYVGAINYRLDFALLNKLISQNPPWTFAFFGPIQLDQTQPGKKEKSNIDALFKFPNVYYGGVVNRKYVPSIIKKFDIAMIPYDISLPFNRYSYPMKLFEYFYVGKPVISSPIDELKRFSKYVRIANNVSEWEYHIRQLLTRSWLKSYQKEKRALAVSNSWEKKVEAINNNSD